MNLLKSMIDKQNTVILETNRIRFFIKTNQLIIGTYLLGDKSYDLKKTKKSTSKSRKMNSNSQIIYHQFQTPAYTNPTILMYTIIKNKPIFLEPLLQIYLKIYPNEYDCITDQGFWEKKKNILDLSIESKSNECFDIILNFFHKYKLEYDLKEKIEYSAKYNNLYTLEKFLNEDQKLFEDIKRYVMKMIGEDENSNKTDDEPKNENENKIKRDQSDDSKTKDKKFMKLILIEISKGILNNIHNKEDSTTKTTTTVDDTIKIIDPDSKSNDLPSDSMESEQPKCSYDGCPESTNLEHCSQCGKLFCSEHISNHDH